MQKLTLTYIDRKERISPKTNKPYTSVSIKAREYNDRFISGFGNKGNEAWKVGDTVEVLAVTESAKLDKNGQPYLNFELPKSNNGNSTEVLNEIAKLKIKLDILTTAITEIHKAVVAPKPEMVGDTNIPYPKMDSTNNASGLDEDDGLDSLTDKDLADF